MAKPGEAPIRAYVHGLRNQTAMFKGGDAELLVGAMRGGGYAGGENAVLLTIEGKDSKTGQIVDVEIAVPESHVQELVARILHRAKFDE